MNINIRYGVWLLPCLFNILPVAAEENHQTISVKNEQLLQRIEALEYQQQQMLKARKPKATTAENTGNPSISVIGTFNGSSLAGSKGVHQQDFLPLSEGEFVLSAAVDVHTRLDVTLTAAGGSMSLEEGFLSVHLPESFRLRAGRKFIPLGRANEIHPHALVYADRPNGLVNLFGSEKFIGDGVFIDAPFYAGDSVHSLMFGFFQNANAVAFDPIGENQFGEMLHWTGIWDINDSTTLELGGTYIHGKNGISGNSSTDISGGYFAVKSSQFDHSGWSIEGEWNRSRVDKGVTAARVVTDGAYLLGEYDFNRNWLMFTRYDTSRMGGGYANESAYSAGFAWKMSEFQSITLQYKQTHNMLPEVAANLGVGVGTNANELLFRWVVAIGPHHPHRY
ncbi:MAG: hypothetical protein Q9N67_03770 [Ghiorsea sp.]|nr:hypothetical protein [Ghiorsea sp.]